MHFFLHNAFNAPVGVFPLEFREKVWSSKTRIMRLPGSEDSLTIGSAVSIQYQRVTDRRTDVHPISISAQYDWRTLKICKLQCVCYILNGTVWYFHRLDDNTSDLQFQDVASITIALVQVIFSRVIWYALSSRMRVVFLWTSVSFWLCSCNLTPNFLS